tara:strand:- start:1889 stop:2377 length:489 start_codon:yes stop_codon:yes gene_type:complete
MKKFDPFEYQNIFYEYDLKITDTEIKQAHILTKDNTAKSDQKTTYYNLNVLNFPLLKDLRKQVIDILDKHKLHLSNNWSQLYNKHSKHKVHIHENSIYSGIIYLQPEKASPTIFYDKSYKEYYYEFKKNKMLLFPSHIPHKVDCLQKNEERLIISFNTRKKL